MQTHGIDYAESFYPVATATTLRTVIAITLYFDRENWIRELVDVEAAFLEEKIKTKVNINLPKGMVELVFMSQEDYDNACAEIKGGVYGCVSAALLWFVSFLNIQ